ncbi:hypothetical protein K491DRAFT_784082 [Lophiostoma macrostomum CBS 122681]|uniref:BTB domain-containing protein n=1 Tax=Lophiostoma macrostomum CBS 122681 TaxID=1314788 RepID=A0A6A6SL16_9PLEO|nr:hypothetical protein K491DRAFT_784082 [Lophiostoma macrostomum CBS 122681]
MGASQSVYPLCTSQGDVDHEKTTRPQPYGVAKNSRSIQLSSSYCTLYDGIVSLVQDNKYADPVLICGDDRYPVHRAIVCPRSRYFEECCAVTKSEVDHASPGDPAKIWIDPSECESHIVAAVLTFLYTLDYSPSGEQVLKFGLPHEEILDDDTHDCGPHPPPALGTHDEPSVLSDDGIESQGSGFDTPASSHAQSAETVTAHDLGKESNELLFHLLMYLAGQKFGIRALRDVSRDKFEKRLRTGPWKEEMIDCIRMVYAQRNNSKVEGLKEDIVKSARARFRILKTSVGWDDLVIDYPEFAAELLNRM